MNVLRNAKSNSSGIYPLEVQVNGERKRLWVRAAETLLYALRDHLGLTGCKPGCENGDCGACTVLLNGVPMKSCLAIAVEADGQDIITIEGLNHSAVQESFVQKQAFQCGYCTPGFILNVQGLLNEHPEADEAMIRIWMESNICRCTSYEEIQQAVMAALAAVRADGPA